MTTIQPMNSNPEPGGSPRKGGVAWVFVLGGALAWVVALGAVLFALAGGDDNSRDSAPEAPDRVMELPTLGAATVTPTITPLPTATPTPLPTATSTPIPLPSATPQPTEMPTEQPTAAAAQAVAVAPTATESDADAAAGASGESAPAEAEFAGQGAAAASDPAGATVNADGCAVPAGWERYTVQQGDTLFAFVLGAGADAALTVDDLIAANCLTSRYLAVDQVLYLPPGAAENAPPSEPYVAPESLGIPGPRTPNCPCVISIPVGWRREQLAEAIQNSETSFTGADFLAVTGPNATAPYDFVQARPAGQSMEGFLFPGTYTVQNETTAEQFRNMLLDNFAANVTPQMRADAAAQGVSFYEALVIASVVQRESRTPETQKLIASVYYNNYRAGTRMGATVTVQYAVGRSGAWWPRITGSDLENPSPFNTYKYGGLPPAPIDSPGLSAIVAAIYPPATEYRFHTASCDGTGEAFSVTYEEHLSHVNCD